MCAGSTRLRGFLRKALLLSFLLSALAIAGRAGHSASLPVRAIRWFLGLDEADAFAVPLELVEGCKIDDRLSRAAKRAAMQACSLVGVR